MTTDNSARYTYLHARLHFHIGNKSELAMYGFRDFVLITALNLDTGQNLRSA